MKGPCKIGTHTTVVGCYLDGAGAPGRHNEAGLRMQRSSWEMQPVTIFGAFVGGTQGTIEDKAESPFAFIRSYNLSIPCCQNRPGSHQAHGKYNASPGVIEQGTRDQT